jgi:hypothetical protein
VQVELKQIAAREGGLRRSRQKQFIHGLLTKNPNGWFGGGGGWMGGDNQTKTRSRGSECQIRTIKEHSAHSAFWMGHVLVGWLLQTCLNDGQIKQTIVFATNKDAQPRREKAVEDSKIAIESI